jgi:hypothetical protein
MVRIRLEALVLLPTHDAPEAVVILERTLSKQDLESQPSGSSGEEVKRSSAKHELEPLSPVRGGLLGHSLRLRAGGGTGDDGYGRAMADWALLRRKGGGCDLIQCHRCLASLLSKMQFWRTSLLANVAKALDSGSGQRTEASWKLGLDCRLGIKETQDL